MTSYMQLLGTDTPNSYGGCCFCGTMYDKTFKSDDSSNNGEKGKVGSLLSDGYIFFNCPEGSQRFSSEANIKLTKIKCFMYTRWGSSIADSKHDTELPVRTLDTVGAASAVMGTPGLLFTINDAGVEHMAFYGPSSTSPYDANNNHCGDSVPPKEELAYDGITRLLAVLRKNYFTYRKMMFRFLSPHFADTTMNKNEHGLGDCHFHPQLRLQEQFVDIPRFYGVSERKNNEHENNCNIQSSGSTDSLISIALPLSPTSLLVGFRTTLNETLISTGNNNSNAVLSYCIVQAPLPMFNSAAAVELGVPKGPLFGQLKNNEPVYISAEEILKNRQRSRKGKGKKSLKTDTAFDSIGETEVVEELEKVEGFWVHPHQVMKHTTASTCIYMSLVLDSNSPEELKEALEKVIGNSDNGGELWNFLEQCYPNLFYYTQFDQENSRKRRIRVFSEVFHLQNASFFQHFFQYLSSSSIPTIGDGETETSSNSSEQIFRCYAEYLFHSISQDTHKVDKFEAPTNTCDPSVGRIVSHVFSCRAQANFTAFPTALTHRYHLNYIAPHLFKISDLSREDESHNRESLLWPYSFKFSCIPTKDMTRHLSAPSKEDEKLILLNQKPASGHEHYIKYPSIDSALSLLSTAFMNKVKSHRPPTAFSHSSEQFVEKGSLVFLGTGSAVPSKYRNVSGTFLELYLPFCCFTSSLEPPKSLTTDEKALSWRRGIVIFDYGEGSSGQMHQLLSKAKSEEELKKFLEDLVLVFISHGHADHHLGLMTLLALRHHYIFDPQESKSKIQKLLVVLPEEVFEFLRELWFETSPYKAWIFEEVEFDIMYPPPNSGYIPECGHTPSLPKLKKLLHSWDQSITHSLVSSERKESSSSSEVLASTAIREHCFWDAEVFTVDHPAHAHAVLLRFPSVSADVKHWSSRALLFSGDTRPCDALVLRCLSFCNTDGRRDPLLARDRIFICLHEATFGPGYEEEAEKRKHSTLTEAIDVHKKIQSHFLVLNHFSQRYPKLPGLTDEFVENDSHKELLLPQTNRRRMDKKSVPDVAVDEVKEERVNQKDVQHLDNGSNKLSFSFDLMRLPFSTIEREEVYNLTPHFISLLEEYSQWEVGTTKRLRE